MMHKILILPLTLIIIGCSFSKKTTVANQSDVAPIEITQDSTETDQFNTQLYIQTHHPYCGGAAPTPDMMNNYSPASGYFILIDKQTHSDTKVLAQNGFIKLQLASGNYAIKESFKNIPFSEFYKKYQSKEDGYHLNTSEECFKKWWSSNLFEFTISDTTTLLELKADLYERCFTGNNPCVQYTGPYPP